MNRSLLTVLALFSLSAASTPPASELNLRVQMAVNASKSVMFSNPALAVQRATVAERLAVRVDGPVRNAVLATALWLEAEGSVRLNEAKRAGSLINAALRLVSKDRRSRKLEGDILLTRGGYYGLTGEAARALNDYQNAYRLYTSDSDDRSRAIALIDIANLYTHANDLRSAIKYYRQARAIFYGDPRLDYSSHVNLGQTYQDLHHYSAAESELRDALASAKGINDDFLVKRTLRIIANLQLAQGKLREADATLAQAARLRRDANAAEDAALLAAAAQAALQHDAVSKATDLIERSFADVDLQHTTLSSRQHHETAYQIYRRSGDTAKALVHLEAMKRLDDEATRLATSTNAALMSARFDFANQELRIAKMQKAEALARARTERIISIAIGASTSVIIVLLLALLVAIRRSRNEVRRVNRDLARTNDALEGALKVKTEFLATTSHEIRTPLNGILGMTQVMLADPALDAVARERVGVVHEAGETMRALVDDILDIAKLETGKLRVEMVPTDLRATVHDLSRLWEEQARAKGLRFTVDLEDCPTRALGDAVRLRQVLGNLLANAVKFTPAGDVTVRGSVVAGPEPRLRIAIIDTGIGIARDKQALVFESFRQADASTTRRFGGSGLGLAICRQLARAMEGEVIVTSEPGLGSTFTLDLPLHVVAAAEVSAPRPSLLVVEANALARASYRALLETHVADLVLAATVDEAVAAITRGGVVRVLADDRALAIDSGLSAGLDRLLQAADAAGAPVALLWTPTDGQSDAKLESAGLEQLIRKPIAKSALIARLFGNLHHSDQPLVSRAA